MRVLKIGHIATKTRADDTFDISRYQKTAIIRPNGSDSHRPSVLQSLENGGGGLLCCSLSRSQESVGDAPDHALAGVFRPSFRRRSTRCGEEASAVCSDIPHVRRDLNASIDYLSGPFVARGQRCAGSGGIRWRAGTAPRPSRAGRAGKWLTHPTRPNGCSIRRRHNAPFARGMKARPATSMSVFMNLRIWPFFCLPSAEGPVRGRWGERRQLHCSCCGGLSRPCLRRRARSFNFPSTRSQTCGSMSLGSRVRVINAGLAAKPGNVEVHRVAGHHQPRRRKAGDGDEIFSYLPMITLDELTRIARRRSQSRCRGLRNRGVPRRS